MAEDIHTMVVSMLLIIVTVVPISDVTGKTVLRMAYSIGIGYQHEMRLRQVCLFQQKVVTFTIGHVQCILCLVHIILSWVLGLAIYLCQETLPRVNLNVKES